MVELYIENNLKLYQPCLEGQITLKTERYGSPGELKFSVVQDKSLDFTEGNSVKLYLNGKGIFFGFVFTKRRTKDNIIDVTAYDQLRYFKNNDTVIYTNKRADEVVKMIADDYRLQVGILENTVHNIPSRIETNATLFDIVQNALDITLMARGDLFVLFDDFGKVSLKNISSLIVDVLIDEETGENFSYTSTIDSNTYNKVKLMRKNKKTGKLDVYIAQDSSNINRWGVLQFFEELEENENGKTKADGLLKLYNKKTRNLSFDNVIGDARVRAGCMVGVMIDLGDIKLNNLMLVEKCSHKFSNGQHLMDLSLRGGEFIA